MAAGSKDDKSGKNGQPGDTGAAEAKQKKKKLLMVIGLAILLVVISVGATFFVVSKMMGGKNSSGDNEASSSEAANEIAKPAIYFPLKTFTVNYDVNGRQRFLQAELTLMYRDEAVLKTLELHMPAVRNSLVMLLSRQVFDELQTADGKEKLRTEALAEIQGIIAKENAAGAAKAKGAKEKPSRANVEQVLFTQFVMQ
jgi:flagellar FliL protein